MVKPLSTCPLSSAFRIGSSSGSSCKVAAFVAGTSVPGTTLVAICVEPAWREDASANELRRSKSASSSSDIDETEAARPEENMAGALRHVPTTAKRAAERRPDGKRARRRNIKLYFRNSLEGESLLKIRRQVIWGLYRGPAGTPEPRREKQVLRPSEIPPRLVKVHFEGDCAEHVPPMLGGVLLLACLRETRERP